MTPRAPARSATAGAGRWRWQMSLPFPLILALRYLRSSRRDAYVSFLSALAAGGITLGVAALLLVLAGLSGLQDFLRSDVLARTPHIEVELAPDADSEAARAVLSRVPGVLEARRILRGRGWLLAGGGVIDVAIVGYEGRLPRFFPGASAPRADDADPPGLPAAVERLAPETAGVYLGDTLSARWGIGVGDLVDVVSARPTLTPLGPQPRNHRLRLAGTFETGLAEDQQPRIAVPLGSARRLFGERQTRIELQTADLDAALEVAERLAPVLPAGSRVKTWQDLNRGLFFALKLEKLLLFLSVFLIVPVAAMALVTVLALLISSKRGEIGMLQAMGAPAAELRRAFLVLGTSLGGFGLLLGSLLGVGGALICDRYRLISPPVDVYFIDHIPFRVEPGDLAAVIAATVLLTLVSTVWAARKAAATRPVGALRE